jgi:4-amino-4-deoxy-L-arabinose transferase-like glycosyltransferase
MPAEVTREERQQAIPLENQVSSRDWRWLWLAVACLGSLLLFTDKAFHIDDPLFLWTARHLQSHPLDPYGFSVNWYDTELPMWRVTQNPPLAAYYLVLAASIIGWSEPALHLAFLLPALGVVLGTYRLAGRLCTRPLLAALAALFTPVFLVSSTSLMCDTLMLCFWVWAVVLWQSGLSRPRLWLFLVAGILIGLSALTKYFGISLVPLLLVYTLVSRRGLRCALPALAIPVVMLAGYQVATQRLYGRGLVEGAALFATGVRWQSQSIGPATRGTFGSDLVIALAFTGGCVASSAFFLPLLWPRRALLAGLLLIGLLIGALAWSGKIGAYPLRDAGGLRWSLLVQLGVAATAGAALLALAGADLRAHRDADALLLFLWLFGTLAFAGFVNWTVNGRSLLPMVPAAGILLARGLDRVQGPAGNNLGGREFLTLIPAAVLALLVSWADYWWANSARTAAGEATEVFALRQGALWFQGHWGFQYYMQGHGGKIVDYKRTACDPGDLLIVPANNYVLAEARVPERAGPVIKTLHPRSCVWLTTSSAPAGAGFYSTLWGPLPFSFGPVPAEEYEIRRIEVPVRPRKKR